MAKASRAFIERRQRSYYITQSGRHTHTHAHTRLSLGECSLCLSISDYVEYRIERSHWAATVRYGRLVSAPELIYRHVTVSGRTMLQLITSFPLHLRFAAFTSSCPSTPAPASRAYFSVQLMTNCAVVTWKCALVKVILCRFDSNVLRWIFSGICWKAILH